MCLLQKIDSRLFKQYPLFFFYLPRFAVNIIKVITTTEQQLQEEKKNTKINKLEYIICSLKRHSQQQQQSRDALSSENSNKRTRDTDSSLYGRNRNKKKHRRIDSD